MLRFPAGPPSFESRYLWLGLRGDGSGQIDRFVVQCEKELRTNVSFLRTSA